MAPRTRRAREAQLAFDAISIEGGVLSPEWLSRIAQLSADAQSESDYRIPKGLNLRDEVGRFWRIAQAYWAEFAAGSGTAADPVARSMQFVTALLRESFGFSSIASTEPLQIQLRSFPIGFAAINGRVPVVVAPAEAGLDALSPTFGDGVRRRSAFGLAQEYLNAQEGSLWGIATDGVVLRIVRDNASLTRPAWIEADLRRIFIEERYADFAALWLLLHETRFGREGQPVDECALERWRKAGREEGTRAREFLRRGVEDALLVLGQGFLAHPDNTALQARLRSGALTKQDYFAQLLRLVYRLIFALTVEERNLLHPDGTPDGVRQVYEDGYSLRRLRERSVKRSAHDRHTDLWTALRIVWRGLAAGEPRLGLPALAGIFAADACAALDGSTLENQALLSAVHSLVWLREQGSLARVNWRDMGPEELGSVYESLLELVPQITADGRGFSFATGGETKGNARKTSGSYYTPDSLVQVLLDTALEPVVADTIAAHPEAPVDALLSLSIVDPACGSGHFLLAAARRLAAHIARLQANGTPSAAEYRHALRQVVGRCIYGVDLNPMAVELCKVALWMEAVEPGLPLSFLDSHIQVGNALLGTTPELMANGIPDEAWEPIEGDDRKIASPLKRRNKAERVGQQSMASLFAPEPSKVESEEVRRAVAALDSAPDTDVASVGAKAHQWSAILGSESYRHQKFIADAWCAAFVWPKEPGPNADDAPTDEVWRHLRDGRTTPSGHIDESTSRLAAQYRFFHWHLQFPQVFARGGFDVLLGNPPWERIKLQEQEFFASRDESIANAVNAAARKKLVAALPESNLPLWDEWCQASRVAEGQSHFVRDSERYPLCGKGDVNTYALFAEHNRAVLGPRGRAGFIVPTGIATDDSTKEFFGTLNSDNQLAAFFSFENEEFVFPSVHHAFRFALMAIARGGQRAPADLVFFARQVSALADRDRHFTLSPEEFALLNPNTRTCPTFRSSRDAKINIAMYRRAGVLWNESRPDGNPWGLKFMAMLHMANDSGLFRTAAELTADGYVLDGNQFEGPHEKYLPLIEAKMVHQFDHRFGTYEGQTASQENQGKLPELDDVAHVDPQRLTQPYYWVSESEVSSTLSGKWERGWLLGWREICRSTDRRTVIAALIPRTAVGNKIPLLLSSRPAELVACLYANENSFALDYAARQKIGGTTLSYFFAKQFPVLPPSAYEIETPWCRTSVSSWLLPSVLELTYTAWDLESFSADVGYAGPPFRWDPSRRAMLRAELDAAFFHLYGISRDDVDYIMDTFPIVRNSDEKAHGEYRTKRLILEVYDAMAEAARTGVPYQTRLDPPPADPRVAHQATPQRQPDGSVVS